MSSDASATAKGMSEKSEDWLASCLSPKNRSDASFWSKLCPLLHITNDDDDDDDTPAEDMKKPKAKAKTPTITTTKDEQRRKKLAEDGFVLVDDSLDDDQLVLSQLRQGIRQLHENHQSQPLPATFILLFDETWELARNSQTVLDGACHPKNGFNFDILAWYIEPGKSGFSPHRDRQPEDVAASFHTNNNDNDDDNDDDNSQDAKFVTQWIALSDATPQNSCLYVIPKPYDLGYVNGDIEEQDPLQRALPDKEAFQHIRALPRTVGQSVLFTHRIIHWGSKSSVSDAADARIAISFVCSDPTYEAPLLVKHSEYFTDERLPPFRIRLLLVCAQLLIYYQRFALSKEAIKLCYEYCKEHELELEENYRRKVFFEFVKAMKEKQQQQQTEQPPSTPATAAAAAESSSSSNGVKLVITEEGDEEDDEDAMLEEMLDAEAGGYGEFEDDYDELDDEDDGSGGHSDKGGDHDDDIDEDEEEFDLNATFAKKKDSSSSPPAKRVKTS